MAKSTLSIEDRLAAIEAVIKTLRRESPNGDGWEKLSVLAAHPDNPYPRRTLINQMLAAGEDPASSPLENGVHFVNTSGRYYVKPVPYLRAMGVHVNE